MQINRQKVCSLLAIIAIPFLSLAQQRSMKDILDIAQKHYEGIATQNAATRSSASIELIPSSQLISDSQESFYLCNSAEDGFVLVSADASMPEILGYSTNRYDVQRGLPPGLLYVMSGYASLVDNLAVTRAPQSAQSAVGPLLKTAWDQGTPYNNMCPRDGATRSMTGCVATAAAQLMKYYEWPKAKPSGVIEYVTDSKKINVSIDLSDYNFAWDMMLDTYQEGHYTNAQASAVSKLMYAVGAVSRMDYANTESGATFVDCAQGMNRYFAYDNDIYMLLGVLTPADQWNNLLVGELDQSRPVLMSGTSLGEQAGHAFVLDGYETRSGGIYYHVNWGWSGSGDGYYLVNNLTPTGSGVGAGIGTYNEGQLIVLNCKPDDGISTPVYGSIESLEVSKKNFASGEPILLDATIVNACCLLAKDFSGSAYFEFVDENENAVKRIDVGELEILSEAPIVSANIDGLHCLSLADGLYTLRLSLEKKDGKKVELFPKNPWPMIRVGNVDAITNLLQEENAEKVYDLMGVEKKNADNYRLPAGFYIIGDHKAIVK